jgi:hypothetical protein
MILDDETHRSIFHRVIGFAHCTGRVLFSWFFMMLFDSNYHDGFAAVKGLIIALLVAMAVFRAILKKLTTWAYTPPELFGQR